MSLPPRTANGMTAMVFAASGTRASRRSTSMPSAAVTPRRMATAGMTSCARHRRRGGSSAVGGDAGTGRPTSGSGTGGSGGTTGAGAGGRAVTRASRSAPNATTRAPGASWNSRSRRARSRWYSSRAASPASGVLGAARAFSRKSAASSDSGSVSSHRPATAAHSSSRPAAWSLAHCSRHAVRKSSWSRARCRSTQCSKRGEPPTYTPSRNPPPYISSARLYSCRWAAAAKSAASTASGASRTSATSDRPTDMASRPSTRRRWERASLSEWRARVSS